MGVEAATAFRIFRDREIVKVSVLEGGVLGGRFTPSSWGSVGVYL